MNMSIQSIKGVFRAVSDKELSEISGALNNEFLTRETVRREAKQKRSQWVEKWFRKYLSHPNATARVIDTTTIVALCNRSSGIQIATACCMPGDTYDYDTGVAVAYAKLCQEPIPDYI